MRRRKVLVLTAVAVFASREAYGEPHVPKQGEILHLQSPTTARTDGGTDLRLPPGYWMDEPTFRAKDTELRQRQENETRLRAENESFRRTQKAWQPGWKLMLSTFVVGVAGGIYIHSKL